LRKLDRKAEAREFEKRVKEIRAAAKPA